ncbi:MAG: hypothetical protein JNM48_06860 [Rhodospirillales bacterium]|nr:hypothetical protein [Rhodospirillales bacterium]
MFTTIRPVVAAVCTVLAFGTAAAAQDGPSPSLTDAGVIGTWAVNEGQCSDPNAEFIIFSKDGTVESIRNGQTDAVGFWKLQDDKLQLNVLAPPARLDERLKDVDGYYPFDIVIAPYDIQPDKFLAVGILGDQVRYGKFARCKA